VGSLSTIVGFCLVGSMIKGDDVGNWVRMVFSGGLMTE